MHGIGNESNLFGNHFSSKTNGYSEVAKTSALLMGKGTLDGGGRGSPYFFNIHGLPKNRQTIQTFLIMTSNAEKLMFH